MRTRITELFGISHPVVLAPMGGVAGGLGIVGCGYGDPKAGYGSPDWVAEQFDSAGNERAAPGSSPGA